MDNFQMTPHPSKMAAPSQLFLFVLFLYFLVLILSAAKLKMLLESDDRHPLSRGHATLTLSFNPLWLEIIHILTFLRGLLYKLRIKRFNLFFTCR